MNLTVHAIMHFTHRQAKVAVWTLLFVVGSHVGVLAQTITRAEYFFDSDPGTGNATALAITPGATISQTYDLNTSALATGFHTFNTRVRDNSGKWSLFTTRTFFILSNPLFPSPGIITRAEYFYDTDPGVGNGTNIPVVASPNPTLTINTPTTSLTPGFHTVNVRVRDDSGKWSLFTTRTFYLMSTVGLTANLVKLEFFVGADPGIGQATPISIAATPTINNLFILNLPALTPGNYTLKIRAKDSNGFWSPATSSTFSVASCTTPAPPTVAPASRCGDGTVTLNASGAIGGQIYRWYADASTTTILNTGSSFTTASLSATTTFFVSIFDSGPCESSRTPVTATMNPLPSPPTTTGASRCEAGSVTLTAAGGTTGQYRWYTVSTGGTAITGETNATFATPTLSANTDYFVAINDGTCESNRTQVTAIINSIPAAPTTTGASRCGTGSVTLNAAGGTAGQYRWYSVSTGGTPIAGETNATYVTPALSVNTDFFVAINNGSCESVRTQVVATINTPPTIPTIMSSVAAVGNALTICSTTSLTLTAPPGFASYSWSTGATTQQISVSASGNYSVTVTNVGGCVSPASISLVVTVTPAPCNNQAPVINTISSSTVIGGLATINLINLISDADDNLVISSLAVLQPPASGANATITNGLLTINYSGIAFTGKDQLTIRVCDIFSECAQQVLEIDVIGDIEIYNGISPNDDGLNDIFLIQYIDLLPDTQENKVTIYNRWGSKVFEVSNYNNTNNVFRGLNDNGNALPSGTYFYKIEFNSGRKSETGYLTLKKP